MVGLGAADCVPAGFRRDPNGVGLFVPEALSRQRQVWTRDEWRLLERCTKMLNSHDVHLLMKCSHPACQDAPLTGKRRRSDGSFVLTCGHAIRVMERAF
jgi:hypothetical protein